MGRREGMLERAYSGPLEGKRHWPMGVQVLPYTNTFAGVDSHQGPKRGKLPDYGHFDTRQRKPDYPGRRFSEKNTAVPPLAHLR